MTDSRKLGSAEYSKYISDKSVEAAGLIKSVKDNIASVFEPEPFVNFLDTVERFHWYSYINVLLIMRQFPNADYIAGYDVWKRTAVSTYNNVNYQILDVKYRGKGIKLIAPFTVLDGNKRFLVNSVVPVYDVNQTNKLPRPENDFHNLSLSSVTDIISSIKNVCPYRVVVASGTDPRLSFNVKGYCSHGNRQIVIDGLLPMKGLLSTLLHEFVVAELYLKKYDNPELLGLVTESIFYVLLKHFNLSLDNVTFSYISKFKEHNKQSLCTGLFLIQAISHAIIEKIEEHLEILAVLQPLNELEQPDEYFYDIENILEERINS